jgi:hypothetical protein
MTVDRDAELAVRAWLEPGVDRLPSDVKRAVMVEIARRPQSGRLAVPAPRRPSFPPLLGVAAGTIAAIVLVAGAGLVGGRLPGIGTTSPSAAPSSTATPVASPSAQDLSPSPRPTVAGDAVTIVIPAPPSPNPLPSSRPKASALPEVTGPIPPGRYAIPHIVGAVSDYIAIDLTLPAGWSLDGRRIVKHAGQVNEIALSWWVVGDVYFDPCHWTTSPVSPIDLVGHGHDASGAMTIQEAPAAGLAGQLGRAPSALSQAYIGSQLALRIELVIPSRLVISACDDGRYVMWSDRGSDQAVNSDAMPGQVDIVYLVDVDRSPLTLDFSHQPGATAADLAELQAIADSIVIQR